jgi:hypothetical protein
VGAANVGCRGKGKRMRPKRVVLLVCRDEQAANVWNCVLKSHGYAIAGDIVGQFPVVDCVLAIKPTVSDVEWLSALCENVLVVMAESESNPCPYTAAGAKYALKESAGGTRGILDWLKMCCARKRGPRSASVLPVAVSHIEAVNA